MRGIFPGAAVLTSIAAADSETDTASEAEPDIELPEPLTAMHDPSARDLSPVDLQIKCDAAYTKLQKLCTEERLTYLQEVTEEQAKSAIWKMHRVGRITGTTFHRVTHATDLSTDSLVQQLMHYNEKELTVPAVMWGRSMEGTARQCYLNHMKTQHANFQLRAVGLVVKEQEPYLAATPDGIFSCSCCGEGAVEIKCPYKYRDGLEGYEVDRAFCLDENQYLRRSHQYYSQVQLQMYTCNLKLCDFVVWTKGGFAVTRVGRDEAFLKENLPKAETFFKRHLLPELICRHKDPLLTEEKPCSKCQRPKFGKMIRCLDCGNIYHCSCVNVTRMSKKWGCGCKK